jgi:hypothetical protein
LNESRSKVDQRTEAHARKSVANWSANSLLSSFTQVFDNEGADLLDTFLAGCLSGVQNARNCFANGVRRNLIQAI